MGSRKDIIKRSLGITVYPWSSDEELEEARIQAEESSLRRQAMEHRPSANVASGSSGLAPQQLSQQQQLHQLQQQHPQAHHHHQQQQHSQAHHHQQNVEHQQQQQATSRRNQARLDRDRFWSIINSPHRIGVHSSRSRSSDVPASYASRVNHAPAAELRERGAGRVDVQRVLAFKRLTRNFSSLRHRGNISGVIPVTHVNPGVIVPSEANSSIRIDRLPIRSFFRTGSCASLPPRNSPGQAAPPSDASGVAGGGRHRSRALNAIFEQEEPASASPPPLPPFPPLPPLPPQPHACDVGPGQAAPPSNAGGVAGGGRHRSRALNAIFKQEEPASASPPPLPPFPPLPPLPPQPHVSDVEVNNNPPLPTSDPIILDEENVDQDMPLEEEHDVEASDNSGANMALDEDVVAIDLENNEIQAQMADDEDEVQVVQAGAPAADDEPGPTAEPTTASTSGATSDADPQQSQNQGVKRKRKDSDHGLEPYTVKEFNLNLLRLLECPVCLEWMEPPMSQCRRGHLVCGRCRARLASCPVCRTTFSSVRNRAMEGVADLLRYPCRHGCGREVRLRRRAPHEASCAARKYVCPTPACVDQPPMPRAQLSEHFQPVEHSAGGMLPPLQGGEEILLEPDYVPIQSGGVFSSNEARLPLEVMMDSVSRDHSLDFANQPNPQLLVNGEQRPWELHSLGDIPYLRDLRERAVTLANEDNEVQRASGPLPLQEENDEPTSDSAALPANGQRSNIARESHHLSVMKIGCQHKFSLKVNIDQHDNWLVLALEQYFHLRVDVDTRTWGVVVYVSYIGPKCDAKNYTYEVTIDGHHNQRKLVYARTTHSDLESASLNLSRQDCFHLTLDQALNFIRFKNRHCDAEKVLDLHVEIGKVDEQPATPREDSDS